MEIAKNTFTLLISAVGLVLCAGCANTSNSLAVKRGQQRVDASELPLVCLAFGTQDIGMPIDSVIINEVVTAKQYKFTVSKSFGESHPDYLTARYANTVLCLVTLKLPAGEYLLDSIEYGSSKYNSFSYSFAFAKYKKLRFRVADHVVNYVGSVEFAADWMPRVLIPQPNMLHDTIIKKSFPVRISVKETAARDCKWVHDEIPGMRELPSAFSQLKEEMLDDTTK